MLDYYQIERYATTRIRNSSSVLALVRKWLMALIAVGFILESYQRSVGIETIVEKIRFTIQNTYFLKAVANFLDFLVIFW